MANRPAGYVRTLVVLELLLCAAAIGGGLQLAVLAPHEAFPMEVLARTPFSFWVWPGVLLILTLAVPAEVVAIGALFGRAYAHPGHLLVGSALIGEFVVQLLVIGPVSIVQPIMCAWGVLILTLGYLDYRRWRTGRKEASEPCGGPQAPR